MIKSHDRKSGKDMYILYPGDCLATTEDCILSTVTGSCVVVCLYDTSRGIGAMTHFIVHGTLGTEGIFRDDVAAHAVSKMEILIGEIVKQGGDRRDLTGKVFGGAHLSGETARISEVVESTTRFIREYSLSEKIPVAAQDIGGGNRRKIIFFPRTGKVLRKLLVNNSESSEFSVMEREYIDRELRSGKKYGKVILFGGK